MSLIDPCIHCPHNRGQHIPLGHSLIASLGKAHTHSLMKWASKIIGNIDTSDWEDAEAIDNIETWLKEYEEWEKLEK